MKTITPVSLTQWREAQFCEKKEHCDLVEVSIEVYRNSYKKYFSYVGLNFDLNNKSIVEIGPAKTPALYFCKNYKPSYIIEPTIYEDIMPYFVDKTDLTFIREPAELCDFPAADEAWLFNVLQHTIDPVVIIERCKKHTNTIRFFEPINTGCDVCHPHDFDFDFFSEHFGKDNTIHYAGGPHVCGFHQHECVYGVYSN
jgi:hypothetical protein